MSKPVVFFSHTSKDSNLVLLIKERLFEITGGAIEIFQSSDGQSIPFGSNWVHKIEEGLNKATIMFIFVTPNSIISNWIYFEAGFAYSKNIRVIPVGIGIDITLLRAPLNLLQGFNIISGDSLNNFVSVINNTYDFSFLEQFSDEDYSFLESLENNEKQHHELSSIFKNITYELLDSYNNKFYNIKAFFDGILKYLDEQDIQYSIAENSKQNINNKATIIESYTLLIQGVRVYYKVGNMYFENQNLHPSISFEISPFNFEQSFNIFVALTKLCLKIDWVVLYFSLLTNYEYLTADSNISAVIFSDSDMFVMAKKNVGSYSLKDKNINFWIQYKLDFKGRRIYSLGISFKPNEVKYPDILLILNTLIDKEVIYKLKHNN